MCDYYQRHTSGIVRDRRSMKPKNGTAAKIAGIVIGGVALLWIGWVSSAIVRAEVREVRLSNVENIVKDMQTSVKDLGQIRDTMKEQNTALEQIIKKLRTQQENHGG